MDIELTPDEKAAIIVSLTHACAIKPNDVVLKSAAKKFMAGFIIWARSNPDDFNYLVERLETSLLFADDEPPLTSLDDVDTV